MHAGTVETFLIVDDDDGFRAVARALLESEGLVVVGEAADGVSALVAAEALAPDVVLLDIQLPDIDGFEVARRLSDAGRSAGGPAVVLVSTRGRGSYRRRLAESTALGFLSKAELSVPALLELLTGLAEVGDVGP